MPVEFGYDDENNRVSMKDPRGKVTIYQHDKLNRRTSETLPTAPPTVTQWRFDAVGNLDQITDGKGQVIGREYDELNRLKQIIYPNGPPVQFQYDAVGNRRFMTDAIGTTEWTYDELNRPASLTDPFGLTLAFRHDKSGNRDRVTYPGDRHATYTFNLSNRLTKTTDWLNREITHGYDTTGRLDTITLPNTVTTTLGYDDASRLTGITHRKGADAPFADYTYTLGKTGTIDATGGTEPLAPTFAASATTYTYDDANQLATLNGNAVTHDGNGNLTVARLSPQSASNDALTFDFENRLKDAIIAGQTTTSTYNGLGHRLAMVRGGQTTRFLVDGTAPLAQIMAETDGSGNVTAFYLHAGGLAARILPDATAMNYHADRRGSTVALTDGAGAVTDRYAYDDFGVPAGSTGSSTNPFRYLGRFGVHDTGDGTLFVRARHYHPDLGRFLSSDPLTGREAQPQSLNRYIYALNNPLALVDVSGFASQEADGADKDLSRSWNQFGLDLLEVWKGYGDAAIGSAEGLYQTVRHPIQTANGVIYVVTNLDTAIPAIEEQIRAKWNSGLRGQGEVVGEILIMVTTEGAGTIKGIQLAGSAGKGMEFSHWVPNRMGGPRSIWNGNYVTTAQHALSDPFRYRFMQRTWKELNEMPNSFVQQWNRIPEVYKGMAEGLGLNAAIVTGQRED